MFQDSYPDLDALKRDHEEGKDYRILCLNRGSWATIAAAHGGEIEPGASAIVRSIALRCFNLFDFQGLIENDRMLLHVTSTKFRDPQLASLLDLCRVALSVHCFWPADDETIWLGGLNDRLRYLMLGSLQAAGFKVTDDSPRFRGRHPKNFVNMPKERGVQLELPDKLTNQLFDGRKFDRDGAVVKTQRFKKLVRAARKALRLYAA